MTSTDRLVVRTHTARDLLQSAALFQSDRVVVWEYVANGLQYVDPGVQPMVRVRLDHKKKLIEISDNGRGMDWEGLENFFVMHGENQDRKRGAPGRGRFGTGKSAAFGIARNLRITTVRNEKRTVVALSRESIDGMDGSVPIPVEVIERELRTSEPNGTTVSISGLYSRSIDTKGIIKYIERHLAKWPKNVRVFVNNRRCEFAEPPLAFERIFQPPPTAAPVLGKVSLVVRVSKAPLEEDLRGISIYANTVWCGMTLAGAEGREMSQYIFGEIDVPALDDDKSPVPALDQSRSMKLNLENPVVRELYAFVGPAVEEVRLELVAQDRARRMQEESRRLSEQAAEISRLLNDDFAEYRARLPRIPATAVGAGDRSGIAGEDASQLVFGQTLPAMEVAEERAGVPERGLQTDNETPEPGQAPRIGARLEERRDSPLVADPGAPSGAASARSRGGFLVKFEHMGADFKYRAQYLSAERTISINLDHPQLQALGDNPDDPFFQRVVLEIACTEYAIALASEVYGTTDAVDPSDVIFDIRDTIARLAARAAGPRRKG